MYGVYFNVLAERHAAIHFKATRLFSRWVDLKSVVIGYALAFLILRGIMHCNLSLCFQN